MEFFKSAFIIGGSSKVAYYICIHLAKNGCERFHLVSRDLNRNKDLIKYLKNDYDVFITQEENDLLLNNALKNNSISKIKFIKDRPGHDLRYALNYKKLKKIGWKPMMKLEEGLKKTISWYKEN